MSLKKEKKEKKEKRKKKKEEKEKRKERNFINIIRVGKEMQIMIYYVENDRKEMYIHTFTVINIEIV